MSEWIIGTKSNAVAKNISFKDSLQDKEHRINYHREQAYKEKKKSNSMSLHPAHPAFTPSIIKLSDQSKKSNSFISKAKKYNEIKKDNDIKILKQIRGKK